MSHKTYDEKWQSAQNLLSTTLQLEPSQADRREHRTLLGTLYIRYIMISNKLSECLDQMVQPQKRILIRKLLEATLGRILEVKSDLIEADLNEFTHLGDILEALNLNPYQIELKIPNYFIEERAEEIESNKKFIEDVFERFGYPDDGKNIKKVTFTEQQAILIIQKHERARQGRLRAQFMREFRNIKERAKPTPQNGDTDQKGISLNAALKIQKIWRGYMARRTTRRRKLQEMLLIGMIPPPKTSSKELEKDRENREYRKMLQKSHWENYKKEIESTRENLEKNQKEVVLEQLNDQVRNWVSEYKNQTGKIPEYTGAGSDRSGSRMLLSRQGTTSEISKSTQGSPKDSKGKKEKKKSAKQTAEEEEAMSTKALLSTFVPELNMRKEEYEEVWKNKDETSNPKQKCYKDIIRREQMVEMENELREVVDEMMRAELLLLQDAMEKDRGHKPKKKSSKKSRRSTKKTKKKKEKDLTPDRTTESLFEELVLNGIIKKHQEIHLEDFKGECSYHPPAPHNKGKDPEISLGDIRRILTEFCVLPLLTQQIHQSAPHVKSLLLAGSKGSGKNMLVQAICTEAGATLFDLSPANIAGKYPGKSGLIMMIHLVVKMSRILQPSVIYMGAAERPFVKKIPKTDKTDPKRLKKDLAKLIKSFNVEDRVVFIGTSSCPWEGDQKLLQQVYQKFLMIPKPGYSSRFSSWTHLLGKFNAITWQFDTSVMSKISDGYTIGSIVSSFEEVMTVKRMLQLRIHPLNPSELVNVLCKHDPIYKEEEETMRQWWLKTPTCRRRILAIEILIQEELELQAKQANAKNKKIS